MEIRNSEETPKPEDRPDHLLAEPSSTSYDAENISPENRRRKSIGLIVAIAVCLVTLVIVAFTIRVATVNPSTHDASVGANYIGLSPEVSGRVVSLSVRENTCVQKGNLLVQIDPHDYEVKLQKAESDQQDLEAQIRDRKRQIVSSNEQAHSSRDKVEENRIDLAKSVDKVGSSRSDVRKSEASVEQARVKYELSQLTVERNRPLAERRYISRQQFDQYLTDRENNQKSLDQAREDLRSSEFTESTSEKDNRRSAVSVDDAEASYQRDRWSVPTLDTLLAQRPSKAAAVEQARKDLERTQIFAPVKGCVTALNISRGAYAREGSALFTLIDSDSWYITAAYRESELRYIRPDMKATVYLMSDPHFALNGSVQSIGNAVTSSDASSVGGSPGTPGNLPMVERSMNWVRLASRYPVRIRFTPRDPSTLRIGTTANVTIDY